MIVPPLSRFVVQIWTTEAMTLVRCRMTPWVPVSFSFFEMLSEPGMPVKISHQGYPGQKDGVSGGFAEAIRWVLVRD